MSSEFKTGGLQYISRQLTNKYDVSVMALILIDAVQDGKTNLEVAKMFGVKTNSKDDFQFISDLIKNTNKKTTLPVFQTTALSHEDYEEMGIAYISGRRQSWLSLTKYGKAILKDINNMLYSK
ncbi:hypothetical protein [Vibrio sp. R78045]|uniref:hypothetical protein n=1 Tax=Vibrio sp. R78045 TaxID=3093868 RepID=UPI0036F26913